MKARLLRALLVAGVLTAVVAVWFLFGGGTAAAATTGDAATGAISRRDMLLGVLTLGVLCLAAFGFDLRDWI